MRKRRTTQQRSSNVRARKTTQTGRTARPSKTGIQRKITPTAARYYFHDGTPYNGKVLQSGNIYWTTTTGAKQGNSQRVTRTPIGDNSTK
jgi:hypothetical protein